LCGHQKWTLIKHHERIEAEEVKVSNSFAGYASHDHKTNQGIRAELIHVILMTLL
jgi:hypothetical protein